MSANHDFLHPRNGINGEGWPDDAHNHCGSLPAGPTPVECPLGIDQRTMAPLLRIQIAKRPEEFQQPSAGYASADVDPEITVAEASMRDSQKKKLNRSRGLLSGAESIEEEMFGEPDQGQKEDDIVFFSGPKNEPKMPRNILINMKKSVCEAGPSKQPPVSPNQQRNFRGSPPLLKNAYEQQATPSGLPTEMGLTKDTSASSNPQTNSKSCQKTSVVSEWKVFVRKKGSCHKQAQHRGEQCTQREVIEFVERSKMWSSVETNSANAENVMMGVTDEELYNLPTAEYAHRRGGFLVRQFTAYHTAFHAAADLKNVELTDTLLDMLNKKGKTPDLFILMQVIREYKLHHKDLGDRLRGRASLRANSSWTRRCYCHAGDIERGLQTFENHLRLDRPVASELFVTLAEGAMIGYTEKGMQMAQDVLVRMNERNIFVNNKLGSELLFVAAGEKTGGYTTANYIWDMMRARGITPSFPAVEAYYQGLKDREIPEDDPRLVLVSGIYNNLSVRFGNRANINL
ncbi:hypothetical protein JHK87_012579 [Glycine soja]|nr:hypothetical protein JHK87_012579 [Glycine soja]